MIWNMSQNNVIPSKLVYVPASDLNASWQSNWDSKHLYFSFSITDNDIQKGDELLLTLDASANKDTDAKAETNSDSNDKAESGKEAMNDQAKTFTFTPYDRLGSQTHLTRTDTGYQLNVAIPWSEIYSGKNTFASNGSKIGVNIKVTDIDEEVKGRKTLNWADTSKPLPKIVLSNTPIQYIKKYPSRAIAD